MHPQLAAAVRWLSEHGPALADLLAKPVDEPALQPAALPAEPAECEAVQSVEQEKPNDMTPRRRNQAAMRLVRRQNAMGGKPALEWRKLYAKLDWQEALCLVLVRATGKLNAQELAAITGLSEADAAATIRRLFMPGIISNKCYAEGTYYVPREAPSFGP